MQTQKLRYVCHLGIRLNELDIENLNKLAEDKGMTKSNCARKILRDGIKKELQKAIKQ